MMKMTSDDGEDDEDNDEGRRDDEDDLGLHHGLHDDVAAGGR
jgi:hypothetical protein